jgi:hypothetical protein
MLKIAYTQIGMLVGEFKVQEGVWTLEKPRAIFFPPQQNGPGVQFQVKEIFGSPKSLWLPEGVMVSDVQDENIVGAYRAAITGIIPATPENLVDMQGKRLLN